MFARLRAPQAVKNEHDREVQKVTDSYRASRLKLGEKKLERLERSIRRRVETWEQDTSVLQKELRELNEFLEGKQEEVDFPFGAGQSSSIDVRYAAAKARSFHANFIRSVFSDPSLVVAKPGPRTKRTEQLNEAESWANWSVAEDCNGVEALKDTPYPIYRDGTALVYGDWERKVERGADFKIYSTVEEFRADYPDAEVAGVAEERYEELLESLQEFGEELRVEYEVDFVAKNEASYAVFPLAKFVWYPLYAKAMRDLELYGYHFRQSRFQFNALVKRGFYDAERAAECRKRSSGGSEWDSWDAAQDELEGISAEDDDGISYRIAKFIVAEDLDGDHIPERYVVYYDMEAHKALRVEDYSVPFNVPCVVPFKVINRSGRLLGASLLKDGRPLYHEINALHRHRSNVRRLTDSVTLLVPESIKQHVDLGAEYAEFRPGMTMYVPDTLWQAGKLPQQLLLHNLSRTGDSLDEEQVVQRYLDGLIGITEGQSGRESALDPDAPASKTAMLLARADMRGEDLILEYARSIPDFMALHIALHIQNAPRKLGYMAKRDGASARADVPIEVLADRTVRWALKPTKLGSHPEADMNKIAALVVAAVKFGFPVQAKPQILAELWNDYIAASRIEAPERFQIEMQGDNMTMGGQPLAPEALLGAFATTVNGGRDATQPGKAANHQPTPRSPAAS